MEDAPVPVDGCPGTRALVISMADMPVPAPSRIYTHATTITASNPAMTTTRSLFRTLSSTLGEAILTIR
jgi:hypothetical protein